MLAKNLLGLWGRAMRFTDVIVCCNLIGRRTKSAQSQRNDKTRPILSMRAVEKNWVMFFQADDLKTPTDLWLVVINDDLWRNDRYIICELRMIMGAAQHPPQAKHYIHRVVKEIIHQEHTHTHTHTHVPC